MKQFRKWKTVAVSVSLIAAAVLALTGCGTVGGVNIGKALTSGFDVKSAEGMGSVSITFELNENANPDANMAALAKLFSPLTITLDEVKKSDDMRGSVKGSIHYSKGDIPFEIAMDQGEMAIQVEGLNQPVVFDASHLLWSKMGMTILPEDLQKQLTPKLPELLNIATDFLVSGTSNPNKISVEDVSQTIHGEAVNLHKIHVELYGDELLSMVKPVLQSMLDDEQGMKDLLGQLYDVAAPVLQAPGRETTLIGKILSNKERVVGMLDDLLSKGLQSLLDDLDDEATDSKWDIFNKDSYLKVNLYVDQDLKPRKTEFELALTSHQTSEVLKSVKITGSSEQWNLNGDVQADTIDTSDSISLNMASNPISYLRVMDHDSQIYQLLKNDLHVTRKTIVLDMSPSTEADDTLHPYIKHSVTLAPARYISEQLAAKVMWEGSTQTVTIIDLETGKKILIKIGSNMATVDGQQVPLKMQAEMKNDTTYMPLRFIVEQLGGRISWNEQTQEIIINKD